MLVNNAYTEDKMGPKTTVHSTQIWVVTCKNITKIHVSK